MWRVRALAVEQGDLHPGVSADVYKYGGLAAERGVVVLYCYEIVTLFFALCNKPSSDKEFL